MSLGCGRFSRITTERLAGHASESDGLELELHLQGCAKCRAEHELLVGLIEPLKAYVAPQLSAASHDRILRALRARRPEAAAVMRPWHALVSLRSAGLAAATALVLVAALLGLRPWRSSAPRDHVLTGDFAQAGGSTAAIVDGTPLHTVAGGRLALGPNVLVEAAPQTELSWRAAPHTLRLQAGSVTVDVTPGRGEVMRVQADHFMVDVVGTRFTVDSSHVSVAHGVVRVSSTDGQLLATVSTGQTWQLPASPLAVPASVPPATSATAPLASPVSPPARRGPEPLLPRSASPPEPLAAARLALARGQADSARALLYPLLRGPRAVAVEARTAFAESFLVEGRYSDAIDSYRIVVRDFVGSAQAESSLFAIAQLKIETSDREGASVALQSYLARYPRGRFAREARDRITRLGATSP